MSEPCWSVDLFPQKSEMEVRIYFNAEMVLPNPTEYYKNTRSYADMRAEYDLLHCNEVTAEDCLIANEIPV